VPKRSHDSQANFWHPAGTFVTWRAAIYVVGNGDEAEGRAYLLAYHGGATTELLASGRYRDRLRRVEGNWRFAERVFIPDV